MPNGAPQAGPAPYYTGPAPPAPPRRPDHAHRSLSNSNSRNLRRVSAPSQAQSRPPRKLASRCRTSPPSAHACRNQSSQLPPRCSSWSSVPRSAPSRSFPARQPEMSAMSRRARSSTGVSIRKRPPQQSARLLRSSSRPSSPIPTAWSSPIWSCWRRGRAPKSCRKFSGFQRSLSGFAQGSQSARRYYPGPGPEDLSPPFADPSPVAGRCQGHLAKLKAAGLVGCWTAESPS